MRKFFAIAVAVVMLAAFSSVYGAEVTLRVGGGLNSNMAPDTPPVDDTMNSAGVHLSGAYQLDERPIAIGIFGEYYFKAVRDNYYKPWIIGADLWYRKLVAEEKAYVYVGPNVGVLSIDQGQERASVFHLGLGAGVDYKASEKVCVFAMGKYAWAAEKNSPKTMNGISIHVGIGFNISTAQ